MPLCCRRGLRLSRFRFQATVTTSRGGGSIVAAAEPKSWWVVEGARHQDFLRYDSVGYESHLVGFLKEHLLARSDAAPPGAAAAAEGARVEVLRLARTRIVPVSL
jgi:hypothetical protein